MECYGKSSLLLVSYKEADLDFYEALSGGMLVICIILSPFMDLLIFFAVSKILLFV